MLEYKITNKQKIQEEIDPHSTNHVKNTIVCMNTIIIQRCLSWTRKRNKTYSWARKMNKTYNWARNLRKPQLAHWVVPLINPSCCSW